MYGFAVKFARCWQIVDTGLFAREIFASCGHGFLLPSCSRVLDPIQQLHCPTNRSLCRHFPSLRTFVGVGVNQRSCSLLWFNRKVGRKTKQPRSKRALKLSCRFRTLLKLTIKWITTFQRPRPSRSVAYSYLQARFHRHNQGAGTMFSTCTSAPMLAIGSSIYGQRSPWRCCLWHLDTSREADASCTARQSHVTRRMSIDRVLTNHLRTIISFTQTNTVHTL
jgi:hypothetical protein